MIKDKDEDNNIFILINEIQNLKLDTQKPFEGTERNYGDFGSMNRVEFNGTTSFDYFRNSSSNQSKIEEYDNYFDDAEEYEHTMYSKNIFRPQDFYVLSTIGKGAYAKVVLAQLKKTAVFYAIKIFEKKWMEKENKKYHIYVENDILNQLAHPNIIEIYGSYEDSYSIYLVLEYCNRGDLADFVLKHGPLKFELAQYFSAQILLSIEYMSKLGIVHRDIKPDNYVIDKKLQLKLVDFSTATFVGKIWDETNFKFVDKTEYLSQQTEEKIKEEIEKSKFRRKPCIITEGEKLSIISKQNFVGTAEFMAPEVIKNEEIGIYTDLWSFGCIIFHLFMGYSPFRDKTEYLTFQNILNLNYKIDQNKVPEEAKDLIENLLKIDPKQRLGSGLTEDNKFEKLKNHKFFKNFDTKNYFAILEEYLKIDSQRTSRDVSINSSKEVSHSEKTFKEEKEKIVKIGELKKKSPWLFYDKRKIILYNTARLDYFDPKTNILKGSINLTKECSVEQTSKTSFNLITPNRTYHFLCKSKFDITPWVFSINEVIKNHCIN